MTKGVYVLHFNKPVDYDKASQYGDPQHYVGVADSIESRVYQHISADGAEMTKAAVLQGIGFSLAAVLPGDIAAKRERFVQKNVQDFCLTCRMTEAVVEKKKTTIKDLKAVKEEPKRVEWATPVNARWGGPCSRCGENVKKGDKAGMLQGSITCTKCIRPEERGSAFGYLNG